ncbi:MAG TPA: hypothetical protein PK777_03570, partial [Thermoguttaceae bacterium]|nr:hypothetical protein [Thermoguttaceae bacterium]
GPIPMAIPLPQPRIGPCDLTIRYRVPWEKIPPRQSQIRSVPLAFPAEGQWMGWQVGISPAEGLQIKLVGGENWKKLENGPEPAGRENRLLIGARELASEIRLGVYRDGAESGRPFLISRAFVQTWWTHSVREDRAVYRVRGEKKEFVVQLPEGASAEEAAVWVNGQPATVRAASEGRIAVALPGEKAEAVVEIRYHFAQPRPARGLLEADFPRPEPAVWIDRFYWLCHFPRDEHLLMNPSGLAPEYQWKWNGWSWGRTPRWSQADLETWVGAAPSPMTPEGVNSYLFSGLGRIEPVSLYTAGRSVLVLTASLAALGIGLLVVYAPAFRHPAWIIAVGVGLGALVLVYPEQTVLGLQGALFGVLLAILAGLLQWMVLGRHVGAARVPGVGLDQESTQHQYLFPAPGSTSSTQVVPTLGNSSLSPDVGP